MSFSYIDVVTKGCEGWLNLFFDDYCITLVNNVVLANKIRAEILLKNNKVIQSGGNKLCPHPLTSIKPVRMCHICGENLEAHR